jgi:small subunit ribosomal protein S17
VSDVTTTTTEGVAAAGEQAAEGAAGEPTVAAAVAEEAAAPADERGFRKVREGLVVSDKMTKTVVVAVEDRVQHPLYGKTIRRTKRVKAHDESSACGVGDRVLLMETRPLSATKRWRVVQILEKAK